MQGTDVRAAVSSVFLRTRVCVFNSVLHLHSTALSHTVHCLVPLVAGN